VQNYDSMFDYSVAFDSLWFGNGDYNRKIKFMGAPINDLCPSPPSSEN